MTDFTIRLPSDTGSVANSEEYFYLIWKGQEYRLRLWDYAEIYRIPGLYQSLMCETLQYKTPQIAASLLAEQVRQAKAFVPDLVALDVAAGCGVSGKALVDCGVRSIVGLDILPEAAEAAQRDYPGVYEQYYVEDLTNLSADTHRDLKSRGFNCLLISGSLLHIPTKGFVQAFNWIAIDGWIVVTIRQSSIKEPAPGDITYLLEQLVEQGILEIVKKQPGRQRFSIDGQPIPIVAIVYRKRSNLVD